MADESQQSPLFRIDLDETVGADLEGMEDAEDTRELLRQLVIGQERQNELLEDLVEHLVASSRQRAHEIGRASCRERV